jgi:predicted dehydrogenase
MSASHAARRFGFRYAASDEAQIINDPEIDVIAVLTRHHLHASQVAAALRANKHVFCEKPLALQPAELEEIRQALQEASSGKEATPLLMVGFNRRFAPLAQSMKAFLDARSEPLYTHYRVNAGYIPLTHWTHDPQQGGGRLVGEGCHFIDFLTFLVGAPPISVQAHGLPDAGRYQEDNLALTFSFPDGSLGLVSYLANGDKAFPKERIEAFSAGRVAVLDDFRRLELVANGRRKLLRSPWRQDKGHRAEWQAFVAAIRGGAPPPIPYEHIFGVTNATFAALQSLRRAAPVSLPTG